MVVTRSQIRNNVVTRGTKPVYVLKNYSTRSGPSNLATRSPLSVVTKKEPVAVVPVSDSSVSVASDSLASPASGALESGALESGALESGTLESGTLESGTLESGALESDTSTSDSSVPGPPVADTPAESSQEDMGQEDMDQEEVVEKQEFKSIIRTRSQKLNEAKMYHENMLTLLENHWNTYNREPDATNATLANYIQNLRSIDSANLRPEFVALVTERLPWFKWKLTKNTGGWSRFVGNVAKYTFLVTLVIWAAYLQVKLTEKGFVTTLYSKVNNFRLLNDISFS